MTDLIDRQEAIDVLKERLQANGYSNVALVSELNRSIGYLMNLPSVDAVEVVRCKDCRHYLTGMFCEAWADLHPHAETYPEIPSRGYCHLAERRTNA